MVSQVQVVSILMIIHGVLTSLVGLLLSLAGPALFALISLDKGNRGAHARKEDEMILTVLSVVYVVLGLMALTAGLLNLIAGIRGLKFRGRTFGLVALFSNLLCLFTVYCAPTSLGLMIYGLIVYFNRDVARAFELAADGVPPEEIRRRFDRGRDRYRDDYEDDSDDDYDRR
jgi:hypothetical protein